MSSLLSQNAVHTGVLVVLLVSVNWLMTEAKTLLVKNKEGFNKLPPLPGMLSYREDNEKLYVNKGNKRDEIGSEQKTNNLTLQVEKLQQENSQQDKSIQNLGNKTSQQVNQIQNLGNKTSQQDNQIQNLGNKNSQQDNQIQNLRNKTSQQNAQFKILENKLQKIETELNNLLPGQKLDPVTSCKDILARKTTAVSGTYWIKLASNKLFQVYCDMQTRGGGWTLVYSYTFTNYNSFDSGSNAVTPRPNWPVNLANVPISTTPPLSESSLGAVDWNVWKDIGKDFMVKSNINDWIVCQPSGGSIVTHKEGSISCQNVKNVATACSGVVPNRINWHLPGPSLHGSSFYYYFDGYTGTYWPTHDPCGKNQQNHKKGFSNPGGQIYLR